MSHEYWLNKWKTNDIAFHIVMVNEYFLAYGQPILRNLPPASRILFPLCGKTVDMAAALSMGHRVNGDGLEIDVFGLFRCSFFCEILLVEETIDKQSHLKNRGLTSLTTSVFKLIKNKHHRRM